MALTTRVQLSLQAALSTALDLVTAKADLKLQKALDLASGVAANQANTMWSDTRTIAASTTEDIDIVGGGLLDPLGVAFAPAKLRVIVVYAAAGNTNNVVLGGDANSVPFLSAATTTVSIQPGGLFVLCEPGLAGIAVTAGTGDIIQVANSGGTTTVTYDIVLIGTTS